MLSRGGGLIQIELNKGNGWRGHVLPGWFSLVAESSGQGWHRKGGWGGVAMGCYPCSPRGWCRRCPLHQGDQREEGTSFPVMSGDLVPEASKFLMSRGQSGDGTHPMWPVSLGVPRDGGTAGPRNHSPMPPLQLPRIPKRAPLLSPLEPSRNTGLTLV